jgi:hypothetical protein
VHVAAAQPGRAAGLAQHRQQVARPARADGRRRAQQQRPQEVRHPLHQRLEARVGLRVGARVARERLAHRALVVEVEQRCLVGPERHVRRVERVHHVPVVLQPQVADHLGLEQRDDVGRARDAMTRPDLLGHARAAEDVAALEHADAQAGAREIARRGQPVVAAADDDGVEVRHAAAR